MRQRNSHSRARGPGMTIIELVIGMVITSLVLGAMSALWYSVGEAWANSSASQNVSLTGNLAAARLESTLRQAKYICQYTAGSTDGTASPAASALIWKGDDWNNTADGVVQIGELALLEHDPVTKRIYIYKPIPTATMNATQQTGASGAVTWSELSSAATVTAFKGYSFVKKTILSEAVSGAAFNVPAVKFGVRQLLEFTLTITRTGGTTIVYSTASLRGATTRPYY